MNGTLIVLLTRAVRTSHFAKMVMYLTEVLQVLFLEVVIVDNFAPSVNMSAMFVAEVI